MGKKSTGVLARGVIESEDSLEARIYFNKALKNSTAELVTDFQVIYGIDVLKEVLDDGNFIKLFFLLRSLESNPESWIFAKNGKHQRPFSYEELRMIRIYESSVRMNLPKNKQKTFKVDYPWKDPNRDKKGSAKLAPSFINKILGIK